MTAFAFFDIELTAKILGVALVVEVLGSLAMCRHLRPRRRPRRLQCRGLNPVNMFDNDAAIKVFGAAAAGVAIFGAFWSWFGFEMAPNYAEESRDPRRSPRWRRTARSSASASSTSSRPTCSSAAGA